MTPVSLLTSAPPPRHRQTVLKAGRTVCFASLAIGLAFIRAIDAAEADTVRALVVEDFDGVAVEDPDYFALILKDSGGWNGCQESEEHNEWP
jgi:hypothetical protein